MTRVGGDRGGKRSEEKNMKVETWRVEELCRVLKARTRSSNLIWKAKEYRWSCVLIRDHLPVI